MRRPTIDDTAWMLSGSLPISYDKARRTLLACATLGITGPHAVEWIGRVMALDVDPEEFARDAVRTSREWRP